MASKPPLPVVCALIERSGRVLLARRPQRKHLALKWEFPGGKVEDGETAEAAIIREIREELGCEIVIERALPRFRHTYGRTTIEMIPFVCQLSAGSPAPAPTEHVGLAWALPGDLETYELAAADLPIAQAYRVNGGRSSGKPHGI